MRRAVTIAAFLILAAAAAGRAADTTRFAAGPAPAGGTAARSATPAQGQRSAPAATGSASRADMLQRAKSFVSKAPPPRTPDLKLDVPLRLSGIHPQVAKVNLYCSVFGIRTDGTQANSLAENEKSVPLAADRSFSGTVSVPFWLFSSAGDPAQGGVDPRTLPQYGYTCQIFLVHTSGIWSAPLAPDAQGPCGQPTSDSQTTIPVLGITIPTPDTPEELAQWQAASQCDWAKARPWTSLTVKTGGYFQ